MKPRSSVHDLALVSVFAAVLAASAFFKIPVPPVPVTLQAQAALLGGVLLGPAKGAFAVGLYLLLGLLGLPVFAGGGGVGYVLQPTFGYLLGMVGGAAVCGLLSRHSVSLPRLLLAQLSGLTVIYLCGVVWYYVSISMINGQLLSIQSLLSAALLTTLPADIILAAVFSVAVRRLRPHLKRIGL